MRAMRLHAPGEPLHLERLAVPAPGPGQVLVAVEACGVCRTDLHLLDGELPQARLPVIPGHEIVGRVAALGASVSGLAPGDRVGVPWLGWTCGTCAHCRGGRENLCAQARFTGCNIDGGYADYTVADARFCFPLRHPGDALHDAPLLCAGLIGHRALAFAGDARRLGLFGFGAAAHIVAQVARIERREVYAFTRPGDLASQRFARALGACWAGDSTQAPPQALDAAIIFAPAGNLVPSALALLEPGGSVVCAGIHMSDIPTFPYAMLWGERSIRSVANLTRADGERFLALAPKVPVRTEVRAYRLEAANAALDDLRHGRLQGAAVLVMEPGGAL
jgi:propanol-preferring alcohol dehydrogenase